VSLLQGDDPPRAAALQALDVRALSILIDELAQRCDAPAEVLGLRT